MFQLRNIRKFRCIGHQLALVRQISSTPSNRKFEKMPREEYEKFTNELFMEDLLAKQGHKPMTALINDPIIATKMFGGLIDDKQMMYPEVLEKGQFDELYKLKWDVQDYVQENVKFDATGITSDVHAAFQRFNLYGYNVPKEFGGKGYKYSEFSYLSEPEGIHTGIALAMNAHRQACEIITRFCSHEQRAQYLPRLASGELVATVAFDEWNENELKSVKTIADYNDDDDEWCIKGTKHGVVNGAKADIIVTMVKTRTEDRIGDLQDSLSVLIVDRHAKGVHVHEKDKLIGCSNLYQSAVTLENVIVKGAEGLVLVAGTGGYIGERLTFLQRLQYATLSLAKMKHITQLYVDMLVMIEGKLIHKLDDFSFNMETNTIRLELAKNSVAVYGVESALYLTAGIMDIYEDTNVEVETAMLKCYSQEQLMGLGKKILDYLDGRVSVDNQMGNELLRDAIQLQTYGEPRDHLKLMIGVKGLRFCGANMHEIIKKKRNPLMHPEQTIQSLFRGESVDKFNSTLYLPDKVISEYDLHANWLESSVARVRLGSIALLQLFGKDIIHEHGEVQKLGDAATMNYTSLAALTRGNRSWILRNKDAPYERLVAACLMRDNANSVKQMMEHIHDGPEETFETHYQTLSKIMMKSEGYFLVHPLFRFY